MTDIESKTVKYESKAERQERLRPVLDQLKGHGESVFLDLCELLLMVSVDVDGAIEWDHPRVVVKIRQKVTAERLAKRRGAKP